MSKRNIGGWKYRCTCGFETLSVAEAVSHLNKNDEAHRLIRIEI
ncbi:MAG: hypothetical protein RMJ31_02065 [Nitrososphaerota archaeon]|nr:hypothetical protein [Nitrososphaerales archaeon]MCX8191563.1 hypothetical protein [Nitrososphaerales archaeon]MDW8044547.1 hypothetical protein [Nitrososphaerota archaeon]